MALAPAAALPAQPDGADGSDSAGPVLPGGISAAAARDEVRRFGAPGPRNPGPSRGQCDHAAAYDPGSHRGVQRNPLARLAVLARRALRLLYRRAAWPDRGGRALEHSHR